MCTAVEHSTPGGESSSSDFLMVQRESFQRADGLIMQPEDVHYGASDMCHCDQHGEESLR